MRTDRAGAPRMGRAVKNQALKVRGNSLKAELPHFWSHEKLRDYYFFCIFYFFSNLSPPHAAKSSCERFEL